jgi:PIN domain nuclease of toxin-antitoxin system
VVFSAASAWEIAIKYSIGKLRLPLAPHLYVASRLRLSGSRALDVRVEHATRVAELPVHHRDPFDRLLIAQAQVERLSIMTSDPVFSRYDVDLIPA